MRGDNDIVVLATFAAFLQLAAATAAGERQTAAVLFARRRLQQQRMRPPLLSGNGVLPRRQWRQASAAVGRVDELHALRGGQRHFLTSTVTPYRGHYRALHNKLELQTMWPGTSRYPDEAYLPATTVSTTGAVL